VLAFLDTEFTDLVIWPRLLSVGVVAEGRLNPEFYAEVTDPDRVNSTSKFGQRVVLPQFGRIAGAACSYADLGGRLSAFLYSLVTQLMAEEFVDLAFGYHLDWELVDLAISDTGASHWSSTRHRIRPVNVYELTGFGPGKLAAEAYFRTQAHAPFERHHALCDARALSLAYGAATQDAAAASPAASVLDGLHDRSAAA